MSKKKLISKVKVDEFTEYVTKCFDYEFTGESEFVPHDVPEVPDDFNIGLIVGSSGSGKSILLREFGQIEDIVWDNERAIVSNFKTPEDAVDRLGAVGFNTIPNWCKPYNVLSNGEQFRSDLARRIKDNAVIDEFTSVVDRNVAKACSASVSKYIRKRDIKKMVFASCHRDIIEWLEPDWVYDTDTKELSVGRELWQRPEVIIEVRECKKDIWTMFKDHHYLNSTLNPASKCYVGIWNNEVVAFSANLCLPGRIPPLYEGDTRNSFRESRLVVLPEYQGLGIGTKMSKAIAEIFLEKGYRYFSKVAHIRVGEHRQHSDLWRPTATNLKSRAKSQKCSKKEAWHHMCLDQIRLCYSHEYIGPIGTKHRDLYEKQKIKDKESKKLEKQKKLFVRNTKKKVK